MRASRGSCGPWFAATLVAVASAGCAGLGNRVDGTLVEVLDTEDPEVAAVIVELDEGDLNGSTDVQLSFDLDVLRCIEGRDGTRADLRPGVDIRAQRFDSDDIDDMDPPSVHGIDVAIRCDE